MAPLPAGSCGLNNQDIMLLCVNIRRRMVRDWFRLQKGADTREV